MEISNNRKERARFLELEIQKTMEPTRVNSHPLLVCLNLLDILLHSSTLSQKFSSKKVKALLSEEDSM